MRKRSILTAVKWLQLSPHWWAAEAKGAEAGDGLDSKGRLQVDPCGIINFFFFGLLDRSNISVSFMLLIYVEACSCKISISEKGVIFRCYFSLFSPLRSSKVKKKNLCLVLFPSPSSLSRGLYISQGTTHCSSLSVEMLFTHWVPCLRPTEEEGQSQLDEPEKEPAKVRKDLENEPDLEGIWEWLTTTQEREGLLWRGPAYKPEREGRTHALPQAFLGPSPWERTC